MSFLAIDIGNTRLKWGVYEAAKPGAALLAHGAEFLENIDSLAETSWAGLPEPARMLGCTVATDAVRRRAQEQIEELWSVPVNWVVSSSHEAGVTNGYDHPSRLGADRWVAMIGARQRVLRQHGPRPLVLAMVGTAVTIETVSTDGRFLGGLILPGHGIMLRALTDGTAGLHVPTGEVLDFPTNTSDALTSGGTFAIAGAIERVVAIVQRHQGLEPVCLMTGGAGWKVVEHLLIPFELVESLIFDGLLEIANSRWPDPA